MSSEQESVCLFVCVGVWVCLGVGVLCYGVRNAPIDSEVLLTVDAGDLLAFLGAANDVRHRWIIGLHAIEARVRCGRPHSSSFRGAAMLVQ